jgi:hypothetical protein
MRLDVLLKAAGVLWFGCFEVLQALQELWLEILLQPSFLGTAAFATGRW